MGLLMFTRSLAPPTSVGFSPHGAVGLRAAEAVLAKTLPPATGGTDGFTHNLFLLNRSHTENFG